MGNLLKVIESANKGIEEVSYLSSIDVPYVVKYINENFTRQQKQILKKILETSLPKQIGTVTQLKVPSQPFIPKRVQMSLKNDRSKNQEIINKQILKQLETLIAQNQQLLQQVSQFSRPIKESITETDLRNLLKEELNHLKTVI